MAALRHNLSRRAVLGAGVVAPAFLGAAAAAAAASEALAAGTHDPLALTPAGPEPVEGPNPAACPTCGTSALRQAEGEREGGGRHNRRWTRALAGFRRAEERLAGFRRYEASLPAAARAWPACRPLEDRSDDLESARLAALRRLLKAPAPDLPALRLKPVLSNVEGIDLAIDDEIAFFSGGDLCLAAVKADALRLCGG